MFLDLLCWFNIVASVILLGCSDTCADGCIIKGANRHDISVTHVTLETIPVVRLIAAVLPEEACLRKLLKTARRA
jgi:hypothetical protein